MHFVINLKNDFMYVTEILETQQFRYYKTGLRQTSWLITGIVEELNIGE